MCPTELITGSFGYIYLQLLKGPDGISNADDSALRDTLVGGPRRHGKSSSEGQLQRKVSEAARDVAMHYRYIGPTLGRLRLGAAAKCLRWEVAGTRNAAPDCGSAQGALQFGLQRQQITHWIEIGRKS